MCGIVGLVGQDLDLGRIHGMVTSQSHRGPDDFGVFSNREQGVALGHNRLSIIDLSSAGHQPMSDHSGRYQLVFNGEIYNYLEIRKQLEPHYSFKTQTDSEVLLASYIHWGEACLERFVGMFAFAIWDGASRQLFAARDRFGVKPFNYHLDGRGNLIFASEMKALHAAGVAREPHSATWATFLKRGFYDHSTASFWQGIQNLPGGHFLRWRDQEIRIQRWYDLANIVGDEEDTRSDDAVMAEYLTILQESIDFRFRADVQVGINLSGGLDSSLLLALITHGGIDQSKVRAFSFTCGDARYDEWPWVEKMLSYTQHPAEKCELHVDQVPELSRSVHHHQDEPFGGLPTLAYAHLFARAQAKGVTVLLDGQGMDEQWAGYDYYRRNLEDGPAPIIQGSLNSPVRPHCLREGFRNQAIGFEPPKPFSSHLRNLQYRDIFYTKIPRALRFNDRVSMRASRELREPFLDHRLVALALKQPQRRKIQGQVGKWLLRQIAADLMPHKLVEAPKRPLQTPQREWLRGPLANWVVQAMDRAAAAAPDWLDRQAMQREWEAFVREECDNSFFIWQWISVAEILDPQEVNHV